MWRRIFFPEETSMRLEGGMGSDRFFHVLLLCILAVSVSGCGGGGGSLATPDDVQTGSFLDGPVCGIRYTTPSWSGVTEPGGVFNYQKGEPITFTLGDIPLGTARAGLFVTPLDLVPETEDPAHIRVVNMCRLLQSLDHDGYPANGIVISEDLRKSLTGYEVDFSDPDFDQNPEVQRLFAELNTMDIFGEERQLISAEDAKIHLEETLIEIEEILAEDIEFTASIQKPIGDTILVQGQGICLQGCAVGGEPDYTFVWNVGDEENFSQVKDPGLVYFYTTGNFPVLLTVTDASGDTTSDEGLVTVVSSEDYGPIPVKDEKVYTRFNSPLRITVSRDAEVHLKAEITMGNPPFYYFWIYPKTAEYSFSDHPLDAVFVFRSPGEHAVSLMVFDSVNQDNWTSKVRVTVHD